MNLLQVMLPELVLAAVACLLFLLGVSSRAASRRFAPWVAFGALLVVFSMQLSAVMHPRPATSFDAWNTLRVFSFADYVKLLVSGVGVLLVLLAWPTNAEATGSASMDVGHDVGEFFALMLLSIAGVFLVAGANDIILLFLGIELASIPTYIMVSISRPLPVAQEAGVKYFFLGAMAAAVMLFGFSYLYGTTGSTNMTEISARLHIGLAGVTDATRGPGAALNSWQLMAVVILLAGFAFKIAAVPLHAYAGDVYQGAATPVTAFLAFVPKTSGFVAIIKLLFVVGGPQWVAPSQVIKLMWVIAVLTMSVGNVLGLVQVNVKRVLAYSSIAHSGYMLVGITALLSAAGAGLGANTAAVQSESLQGVLFYLAAYGIMNAGAFGVLMLLPARETGYTVLPGSAAADNASLASTPVATTAETFEDLAGQGRRHPGLGLAMAVCCFSLIGLPVTIGFFGKFFLIKPALDSHLYWLAAITVANAAVSAAYYLRIVATMFLREDAQAAGAQSQRTVPSPGALFGRGATPVLAAILLSAGGTLVFGVVPWASNLLSRQAAQAANIDGETPTAPPVALRADASR